MSATVYRIFNAEGALLYVGCSTNTAARVMAHDSDKPWWSEVANITCEHFEDRVTAAEAEVTAILTEAPRYNVKHQRDPIAMAQRAAEREARQAEVRARLDSSYFVRTGEFACTNCGRSPGSLPVGVPVVEVGCPSCQMTTIRRAA